MTRDEMLIGWLSFMRMQNNEERPTFMPESISAALVEKGWLEIPEQDPDWEGLRDCTITDLGIAVTDLAAPEWGIEPDFVEADQ